jgi:hypothetical protein
MWVGLFLNLKIHKNMNIARIFPLYWVLRNGNRLQVVSSQLQSTDDITEIRTILNIQGINSKLANPYTRGSMLYVSTSKGDFNDKISYIYQGATSFNLYLSPNNNHTNGDILTGGTVSRDMPREDRNTNDIIDGELDEPNNGSTTYPDVFESGILSGNNTLILMIIVVLLIIFNK